MARLEYSGSTATKQQATAVDVATNQPAILFDRLSYRYPDAKRWALDAVSLSIQPGEFIAVVGPNGAGKSTFCKCLNGIVPHFEGGTLRGSVFVHGRDTTTDTVANLSRTVGLVLEDPDAQLFAGTVLDEAAFGPENLGMEPLEIRASVARALRAVGLRGLDERPPTTLSGGQKQRLAIAGALAMTPRIIVFDEATSQLDAEGSHQLMELVSRLRLRYQLTVVLATHDMRLVSAYADRVVHLEQGGVAAFGPAGRVLPAMVAAYSLSSSVASPAAPPAVSGAATGRAVPETVFADLPLPGSAAVRVADRPAPVVRVTDLRCTYPGDVVAIDGVSFSVTTNQFVGIVGRNGSGKTSLLSVLAGVAPVVGGDVQLDGRPAERLSPVERSRLIGYVQQNPDHQLFADSVWREVAFGPQNLRLPRSVVEHRVREALAIVGLSERAGEHPLGMARGDRSLVALGSVLSMQPQVLLLDEPTRGQDLTGSMRMMEIAAAWRDSGRAVIAIGHDIGLLCDYVDRLIVMDGGRISCDGPACDVILDEALLRRAGVMPDSVPASGAVTEWDADDNDAAIDGLAI